mmetsp:Transcript_7520/g.18524  ORF Transcript_7520/g.18524 Transcript_7520/m.18524 type:complete len:203 (+) Transcript_7520:208-816(+)
MKTTRQKNLLVFAGCLCCYVVTVLLRSKTMIPVPVEATMNSFKSSWCSTSMAFVPRTVDGQVPTSERHSSTILRRRLAGSHPKVGSFNNRRGVVSSSSSSSTSLSLLGSDDVDLISATNIPCLYNHKIRHHHQHQHKFQQKHTKHTTLFDSYRPYDNLFSGLAEISLGCSIGVLWSEISIALTGCGPSNLSDTLERICYLSV